MLNSPLSSLLPAEVASSSPVLPTKRELPSELTIRSEKPEWFAVVAKQLIIAANKRWPRFGPWQVLLTYREDGSLAWMLRDRSWRIPDVGDKARIGTTLAELERRVCVDRDD
jgi:hypothetical protein